MQSPAAEITLVEVLGLLPGSSNATLLAVDAEGTEWVYKPSQGERQLWDFPHGTLAWREVASYRISEALGFGLVPETVVAEGPFGPGSAQRYLTEDVSWDPRPLIVEADTALWPVAIFDLVANNADRKIGHLLREPGKDRLWAIDHGLTFHTEDKLRTVLWQFASQPIPPEWLGRLDPVKATAALEPLLSAAEIEATVARMLSVVEKGVHPDPPIDRPALPWPLW